MGGNIQGLNRDNIVISFLLHGLPWWLRVKVSAYNAGDLGLIPGSGRSPGEGNGNPLQYSCLENPMVTRASWTVEPGGLQSTGCKELVTTE